MAKYGFHFNAQESLLYIMRNDFSEIKIEKINHNITRVRFTPDGIYDSLFSYARDPEFVDEKVNVQFTQGNEYLSFESENLKLLIDQKTHSLRFLNASFQNLLSLDSPTKKESDHGEYYFFPMKMQEDESIYGLGDKPVEPNLRGKSFQNWGTDTFAYSYAADPLYKNIPFFIGQHEGGCYGVFLDSSYRTVFDFTPVSAGFGSYGENMTFYFFEGKTPTEIIQHYLSLTGTPELPPLWALGYHQCKWSYYPEKKVKKIAKKLRKLKIPCDAIYLDIDYMDGFRCFTWDNKLFPHPKKLIQKLDKQGFKTVVMIDPGLKIDKNYPIWKDGKDNDLYCKTPSGKDFKGMVWPGPCNFPDFTLPKARDWWSNLFEEFIGELNVAGVWNDMNEPALYDPVKEEQTQRTFPDDILHDYDYHHTNHAKAHNVYGMQMSRATYEGIKKFNDHKRPFVITRSTFSGGQRYACVWTGDNVATWEHLKIANWQVQNLSVSGFSFAGSDIGGFIGEPDGELYVRWLQLAVFHPFFRTHSSKDSGDQEPWSFGKPYTGLARQAIELRYRLLPYIYTSFEQYVNERMPMILPLRVAFPEDVRTLDRMDEFLFGSNILVSPIVTAKTAGRWTYLPEGDWYKFESNERISGRRVIFSEAGADEIPFYIKAGAVIPIGPVIQYSSELRLEELELQVYVGSGEMDSYLYLDAGEGYGYQDNDYKRYRFRTLEANEGGFLLQISKEGDWLPALRTFKVRIFGYYENIERVLVDGMEIPFAMDEDVILVDIPENAGSLLIK